jgi:hypothetical protein
MIKLKSKIMIKTGVSLRDSRTNSKKFGFEEIYPADLGHPDSTAAGSFFRDQVL